MEERECPILDGIPIASIEKIQEAIVDVPPAPPPMEASQVISDTGSVNGEGILPLTHSATTRGRCLLSCHPPEGFLKLRSMILVDTSPPHGMKLIRSEAKPLKVVPRRRICTRIVVLTLSAYNVIPHTVMLWPKESES